MIGRSQLFFRTLMKDQVVPSFEVLVINPPSLAGQYGRIRQNCVSSRLSLLL
jgi:hypothetical protein